MTILQNNISKLFCLTAYMFSNLSEIALLRTTDLKNGLIIDLHDKLNLDYIQSGAGNDFLLFLNTALHQHEYIYTLIHQ